MKGLQLIAIAGAVLSMTACGGLGQMQGNVTQFDQGVHSASTAEMNYLKQVQTADSNQSFYDDAYKFATKQTDPKTPFDLQKTYSPDELTAAQLNIRQKLMDTITLYADAIQALASGTDNTNLSSNSKTLVTNLQALLKQEGVTAVTATDTAALNTAVVTITNMILDRARYKDIKNAAITVQPALVTVVNALKAENLADADGLASKTLTLKGYYQSAIVAARDQKGAASFFDVVEARNALQPMLVTPNVTQLNNALDALVKANQAFASATNGGAIPEISDLVSRAQQAASLFNSSK